MRDPAHTANPMENLGALATAALIFSSVAITIGVFGIGAALPRIADAFAAEPNARLMVQIAGGIAAPAFALASPFAGRFISRHGERTTYVWSIWLVILTGTAGALVTAPWQLIALRALLGVGIAGVITAAKGGIGQTGERRRHLLYSLVAFLGSAAGIAIYPLVGALAKIEWRYAFLSNLLLIPLALLALTLPRLAVPRVVDRTAGSRSLTAGLPLELIFTAVACGWAIVMVPLHAPFYLKSVGITDPVHIGSVLSIASTFTLAGALGYTLVQRLVGTRTALALALGVIATGAFLTGLGGVWPLEFAGLCLAALGTGVFAGAIYAYAMESAPRTAPGEIAGMVNLSMYGPQILFPMAAGAVSAALGPASPYAMVGILIVVAMIANHFGGRRRAGA